VCLIFVLKKGLILYQETNTNTHNHEHKQHRNRKQRTKIWNAFRSNYKERRNPQRYLQGNQRKKSRKNVGQRKHFSLQNQVNQTGAGNRPLILLL
jgi:hypothetical protein